MPGSRSRGAVVFAVIASASGTSGSSSARIRWNSRAERNRQLAFGQGVHYCLGAPLARLEGQIAINTLLGQMPDLAPGRGPGKWMLFNEDSVR